MGATLEQQQRVSEYEEALLEQGRRIRALHEIISRPDLTFDQQIDETLRLGCQLLGTEIGKVGRQDPEHNTSEFLNTVTISELPVRRGMIFPLDKTFCNITFSSAQTIAISHVEQSEYMDHPAARFLGIQSYIGCSINVHGKKFGTINFSNRAPVSRPFTEADKDLVNLMGSWISVMMERQFEAEELRKSKERAEAANQAKSTFLANMSHEIRTPLTSIIGFAEAALDSDQTMEQRLAALRTIRQSGDHLLHLINDVLDFSKIEASELDVETTILNPVQMISEVESIVSGQATKKQLEFSVDYQYPLPEEISSDPLRLKQIMLNLCSNAIKFTDSGAVRMSIQYDAANHTLDFSVSDTGIGMTEEQLQKIFQPFRQADTSTSRRFGGTGLGLFLSRRLAELLGCTLAVRSEAGVGSEFTLSLPLQAGRDEQARFYQSESDIKINQDSGYARDAFNKLRGEVLLVEDNHLNQQLIQMYLQKMGATVTVAENGAVAVNLARQHTYDLIYMDMQMPVLPGPDAVRMLRENDYTGPIVMLTANVTLDDRNLCEQAGSTDFLTKPIDRQKLYNITERYLYKV